jgi:endonuclease/exonuclease/phosphatase family metal-dependent hydrolase
MFLRLWILAALLSACADPADQAMPQSDSVSLKVMTFNIEYGGAHVSFDKVIEAIQKSDPDIVGIQEAEGNLQRLASELGWHYDLRNYVVSKYPLLDPPGAGGNYVFVEVVPGKMVAISNIHLPSDPYGPDAVRNGASVEEVLQLERNVCLPKMQAILKAVQPLLDDKVPLFLTGDFNAPAHTDWPAAAVGTRPFLRYAMQWPVSLTVHDAGFRDSWRETHADVLESPGLTWWAGRPALEMYAPGENDAQDRIDFIWFSGPVEILDSKLVGEPGYAEVSVGVSPWPSDHRAVVSTFAAVPVAVPRLVTTHDRVYRSGDNIDVISRGAGDASVRVALVDNGGGQKVITESTVHGDGVLHVDAGLLDTGRYRVTMQDKLAQVPMHRDLWVLASDAKPAIEVLNMNLEAGDGIEVRWSNAPGNRNDYVVLARVDGSAADEFDLPWTYVAALPHGELRLDSKNAEWGWPPAPGTYVARLMKDDGYEVLAESGEFTISR